MKMVLVQTTTLGLTAKICFRINENSHLISYKPRPKLKRKNKNGFIQSNHYKPGLSKSK